MSDQFDSYAWERRRLLTATAGIAGAMWLRSAPAAQADLAAAIAAFAAGAPVRAGRVVLDIAPLVENGNVVPVRVEVQSPMSEADHVKAIAVFNERNPQRDVIVFHLGPLVAVAQMNDGSCWTQTVDVIVTLAACVEP
jgi:sulfur-oxidizing protein SoxY